MMGHDNETTWGVWGDTGKPILLIHGYPFNSQIWNRTSSLLVSQGWKVMAPDLRGFRKNLLPDDQTITTMECFADDLFLLLQQWGVTEKIPIVGLSMGGYIAMQFARKYADHLSSLVLCGTKTTADPPSVAEDRRKQAAGMLDGTLTLADIADAMIPKLFSVTTHAQKPELISELRNIILESRQVQGIAAAAWGMAERQDTTEVLRQLQVPVLAVCGADDQFSPPSSMRPLAALAKQGTYCEIPEAGHLLPMEQPERFADVLNTL